MPGNKVLTSRTAGGAGSCLVTPTGHALPCLVGCLLQPVIPEVVGRCRGHPVQDFAVSAPAADGGGEGSSDFCTPSRLRRGSPDCRTKSIRGKAIRSCPCKEKNVPGPYSLARFYRGTIPRYPQSVSPRFSTSGNIPRSPYLGQHSSVMTPRMTICVFRHFYALYTSDVLFHGPYLDRLSLIMTLPGGSPPTVVPEAGAVLQPRMQGHTSFTNPFSKLAENVKVRGIPGHPTPQANYGPTIRTISLRDLCFRTIRLRASFSRSNPSPGLTGS